MNTASRNADSLLKLQAENDAHTLAEANTIKADNARNTAAKKMAKKMATEASQRVKSLQSVAGEATTKSNTKLPGIKKGK